MVVLFLLVTGIQFVYLICFFAAILFTSGKHKTKSDIPLSIVICAKNEYENLIKFLPAILAQRYIREDGAPNYEILVIDDSSTDDSLTYLTGVQKEFPHFRFYKKESKDKGGKKELLLLAADLAKHEYLVLIDADCVPLSENWLAELTVPFHEGKSIVSGYGKYFEYGGWLNSFIRWETMHSFIQSFGYFRRGVPAMGVGRNMGYYKSCLNKASEDENWLKTNFGDDDLLISAAATPLNFAIVTNEESWTISKPKTSFGSWLAQKQRHVSAGKYYSARLKYLYAGYAFSHAAFWILFFYMLISGNAVLITISILFRIFPVLIIYIRAAQRLKENLSLLRLFIFDIAWALYNFILSPYIFLKDKKQWK